MLEEIKKIVLAAGALIKDAHAGADDISDKGGCANYVTGYDVQVQEYLQEKLTALIPGADFLGEENASHQKVGKGYCFVVDPIDGTANFITGHGYSALSVGLALDGVVRIGVIYNPFREELYWAERGKGAWFNGKPMHMEDAPIKSRPVCLGTAPYDAEFMDATFLLARRVLEMGTDIRRLGSAALDLCMLASNRCGLFFEMRLSSWDYAAAWVILEEAGALVTTLDGTPVDLNVRSSVLAGSPAAHREFLIAAAKVKQKYDLHW